MTNLRKRGRLPPGFASGFGGGHRQHGYTTRHESASLAECMLEEVEAVRAIGCDRVQGFFFSRPLSSERLAEFCKARQSA